MISSSASPAVTAIAVTLGLVTIGSKQPAVLQDLLAILTIFLLRNRHLIGERLAGWLKSTEAPIIVGGFLVGGLVVNTLRYRLGLRQPKQHGIDVEFLKPMLFPCRTTHTRLFPKVHSFSYSYLFAGIPIGWQGRAGTLLSAETDSSDQNSGRGSRETGWFSVEPTDYLQRGTHEAGLQGKLHQYLLSQGIDPSNHPFAYLVTAPRFLGFSFNPVSFWYLYSSTRQLSAMILEVNNTFDERRMYFMESTNKDSAPFKNSWPKDFHVSPFNSRDGSYSVTVQDLVGPKRAGQANVDVNIVLHAPHGKPKLVARVFSIGEAVNPETTSWYTSLQFVLRWWWVGFMTNPRILREARKLWSKGLQVFYRPEVRLGSIGRQETPEETVVEANVVAYLQDVATKRSQTVRYTAAAGPKCGIIQQFGSHGSQTGPPTLELVVLTPGFYAEVARLGSIAHALQQVGDASSDAGCMVHVSDQKLSNNLLRNSGGVQMKTGQVSRYWRLLALVRAWRAQQKRLLSFGRLLTGNASHELAELDQFVLERAQPASATYFQAVQTILMSDLVAFGSPALLRFYRGALWFFSCVLTSYTLDVALVDVATGGPREISRTGIGAGLMLLAIRASLIF